MYDNPSNPRRHFRKLRGKGRPEKRRKFLMTTTLANGKKAKTSFVTTKSDAFARANRLVGKRYHGSSVKHVVLDYDNKAAAGEGKRQKRKKARKSGYKRSRSAPRKKSQSIVGIIPSLFGFGEAKKAKPAKRSSYKRASKMTREERREAIRHAHGRAISKKARADRPRGKRQYVDGPGGRKVPTPTTREGWDRLSRYWDKQDRKRGFRGYEDADRAPHERRLRKNPRSRRNKSWDSVQPDYEWIDMEDAIALGRAYAATSKGARGHGLDESQSLAKALQKREIGPDNTGGFIRGFRSL